MGIRGHCNIYAIRLLFYQHFFIAVISRLQAVFTCEGLRPFHGFTRNRRHLAVCDTVHRIAEFVCNISCPHYCKSEISHNNTSSVLLSCTNGHLFFLSDDNSFFGAAFQAGTADTVRNSRKRILPFIHIFFVYRSCRLTLYYQSDNIFIYLNRRINYDR